MVISEKPSISGKSPNSGRGTVLFYTVGATIGRPQILHSKICRRKAKVLFFGGRSMIAPTLVFCILVAGFF